LPPAGERGNDHAGTHPLDRAGSGKGGWRRGPNPCLSRRRDHGVEGGRGLNKDASPPVTGWRLRKGLKMVPTTSFPDKKVIAELTAKMFLEVEAVRFMGDKPFIFTSGRASPVYTDCRRLISFPRVRTTLMDFGVSTVLREIGFESIDAVAGGETAGIPFAAWMAERMNLPMLYVRKQA